MWHRIRLLCPEPVKVALRRARARFLDPLSRGVEVDISGMRVRVPAYFFGGGRSGYELASVERFRAWLSTHPSGLVIDVGCSVSTYGVIALCSSPTTGVIAIDPDFASLVWTRYLCSKVQSPERLRLVHGFVIADPARPQDTTAASAAVDEELRLRSPSPYGMATRYQDGTDPEAKLVPRHSIDALLDGQECPGGLLLKVDVEGNEVGVLKGAARVLSRIRPALLLSVHPQFGVDTSELRRLLQDEGYTAEHFATDHEEHWWCSPREIS